MRFNIGDRVRVCCAKKYDNVSVGECGTVVEADLRSVTYAVRFDERDIIGKHNCDGLCEDGYGWWCDEDMLEPIKATRFKIGDRVRVLDGSHISNYTGNWNPDMQRFVGNTYTIAQVCNSYPERTAYYLKGHPYVFDERGVEPAPASAFRGGKIPTTSKPVTIEERFGFPKGVSIHDLPTSEWYNPHIDLIFDRVKAKELAEQIAQRLDKSIGISKTIKEEKKMPTKFTFYVTEGTRPDKKCNGVIQTMTTNIELLSGNAFDGVTTVKGSATCDKADYDERQGVLEALANAICGSNFYKAYAEAVKLNRCEDELSRTCIYCGKILNTVEEKQEHEAWHVECRKARHERYLLRKRAKEIAFEEAAQKLAKEIIAEDNKK